MFEDRIWISKLLVVVSTMNKLMSMIALMFSALPKIILSLMEINTLLFKLGLYSLI